MPQIFHPRANTIARVVLFGAIVFLGTAFAVGLEVFRSPYTTGQFVARHQPVPFSHEHHVGGLGLDCRYCHTAVEDSSFAGMPPTKTCMTCHSQIWTNAEMLQPVRDSWNKGAPIVWQRVHRLPDHVQFNHSIHVAKGVGCATCHGQVDAMPLMWQTATLRMEWCLDCHRAPEKYLRPKSDVFNMRYTPPPDQLELGRKLVRDYHVRVGQLDNCYICHR